MASKWKKAVKLGAAAALVGGGGGALLYMSSVVSADRKKEQVRIKIKCCAVRSKISSGSAESER